MRQNFGILLISEEISRVKTCFYFSKLIDVFWLNHEKISKTIGSLKYYQPAPLIDSFLARAFS